MARLPSLRPARGVAVALAAVAALAAALVPSIPAAAEDCVPDDRTLCLLDGRFRVRADYRNQHAGTPIATATAQPLTAKVGVFWFFAPDNYEVMVKVLDGRSVNGDFWVFIGSLSDVEFWVYVDDVVAGRNRVFHNLPGNRYGIADTMAFADAGPLCEPFVGLECAEGSFCEFPVGTCGFTDGSGMCVEVPGACLSYYDPVCGCDGVTYSNECYRRAEGVSELHDGPCEAGEGIRCGGIVGVPCPADTVCDLDAGFCGGADIQGTCVHLPDPEVCDLVTAPPNPVCGCDGATYPSDCHRLVAGVQLDHPGPCP